MNNLDKKELGDKNASKQKNKYGDSPYSRLERVKIHQRIATRGVARVANKLLFASTNPLDKA